MDDFYLGYKIMKPVETQEDCDKYSAMADAINEHNFNAQPGDACWTIEDYEDRYEIIESGTVPTEDSMIDTIRENKLTSVSATCEQLIYDGIDVTLSSGEKHFSLQIADQSNIDGIFNAVTLGATAYPYHADGELCTMFSATDIVTLYMNYKSFVTTQTTYCNALRQWIMREEDKDKLTAIEYGTSLPDDLNTEMNTILAAAQEQVQAIVGKLTSAVSDT